MRTRSRSRRNDLEHPPNHPVVEQTADLERRLATIQARAANLSASQHRACAGSDLEAKFRSDVVLRNVGILAFLAAIALAFLNIFLYTAIFSVGLLAPAWQTFKALESRRGTSQNVDVIEIASDDDSDEDYVPPGVVRQQRQPTPVNTDTNADVMVRNWQTYWVMAAMLFAADGLILKPLIAPLLPSSLYAAGLFSSVTWLTRNKGGNAHALYTSVVRPAFVRSEKFIDKAVEVGMSHVDSITQQAVVKVNEVVTPYARQLEHAAAVTSRQIQETQGRLGGEFARGRFLR